MVVSTGAVSNYKVIDVQCKTRCNKSAKGLAVARRLASSVFWKEKDLKNTVTPFIFRTNWNLSESVINFQSQSRD